MGWDESVYKGGESTHSVKWLSLQVLAHQTSSETILSMCSIKHSSKDVIEAAHETYYQSTNNFKTSRLIIAQTYLLKQLAAWAVSTGIPVVSLDASLHGRGV